MKKITLEKPELFALGESPAPTKPGPGEALVRVRRVGICGTDVHAYRGRQPFFKYPRVLGHELGVEVVALGELRPDDAHRVSVGDRCTVEPYLNCRTCIACRCGKPNCCEKLTVLGVHADGGMCESIIVPVDKLHVSNKLDLDQLALIETLGIGAHAVDRAALRPGEHVLVIGAGPIGLSVIPFAKLAGARVVVMDVNARRLEFARKQFGVDAWIVAGAGDDLHEVRIACRSELPTAVFDATGNATSMMASLRFAASGGRVVFVSLVQADITFSDPEFHRRELTLLATRNSRPDDFRRIISLVESGKIDTRPWITHRASCDAMIEQFPSWLSPDTGVIKAMVEF